MNFHSPRGRNRQFDLNRQSSVTFSCLRFVVDGLAIQTEKWSLLAIARLLGSGHCGNNKN